MEDVLDVDASSSVLPSEAEQDVNKDDEVVKRLLPLMPMAHPLKKAMALLQKKAMAHLQKKATVHPLHMMNMITKMLRPLPLTHMELLLVIMRMMTLRLLMMRMVLPLMIIHTRTKLHLLVMPMAPPPETPMVPPQELMLLLMPTEPLLMTITNTRMRLPLLMMPTVPPLLLTPMVPLKKSMTTTRRRELLQMKVMVPLLRSPMVLRAVTMNTKTSPRTRMRLPRPRPQTMRPAEPVELGEDLPAAGPTAGNRGNALDATSGLRPDDRPQRPDDPHQRPDGQHQRQDDQHSRRLDKDEDAVSCPSLYPTGDLTETGSLQREGNPSTCTLFYCLHT